MNRVAIISALVAASSTTQIYAAKGDERPNIIFILTDDQPYTLLGHSGHPTIETPNLDRLSERGTFFNSAYVSSPLSKPSRTCILTGRYERNHGVDFNSATALSDEAWAECYPMLLKNSGYYIGYLGKNHTPIGDGGYESGLMESSFDYWFARHQALHFYPKEVAGGDLFKIAKADTQVELLEEGVLDFLGEQSYNATTAKKTKLKRGEPFFLNICLNVPHGSSTGTMKLRDSDPELYLKKYREDGCYIPRSPLYVATEDIHTPKLPLEIYNPKYRQPNYKYVDTPETLRERNIREMATVTAVDNMVGALLSRLEEMGVADNTVIAFTADNGLFNGEYGIGGKAFCYEIASHVPMFIYDPRLPAKGDMGDSDALVLGLDLSATFLDYAGVEIPDSYQGHSLRPIVEGEQSDVRDYLFVENLWSIISGGNPNCMSVRDKEWKYIRYYRNECDDDMATYLSLKDEIKDAKLLRRMVTSNYDNYRRRLEMPFNGEQPVYEELFNLKGDPSESTNLIGEQCYAEILERLRSECDRQVVMARGEGEPRVYKLDMGSIIAR